MPNKYESVYWVITDQLLRYTIFQNPDHFIRLHGVMPSIIALKRPIYLNSPKHPV